jgi:hypothetical protein
MSDNEWESGEDAIDESGRNPTQQRMDEEGEAADQTVEADQLEPRPHEGEEGQDLV